MTTEQKPKPKRIFLSPPHMCGKELEFVKDAFVSNWIAPVGPHVDAFEKEFCEASAATNAAAVNSGTAALHLAVMLSGVGPGDEVACSTFTFAGSAFPIVYRGATPVFVDADRKTWNMEPQIFEDAVKDRKKKGKTVKAVIVVHLYGQSADMDPILDICKRYGIACIEDAAESLGATYKGKQTGTVSRIGIFSFNGNKIVTASGGGMLVSVDKKLVEKARFFSTQARDAAPHYEHSAIGYNYRMSNVCAAIGRGQLSVLRERVARKREIYSRYEAALSDIAGISFMPEAPYGVSNRWLTCMIVDQTAAGFSAEDARLALEAENIESRPLWKPMHMQPVFASAPAYINGVSEGLFKSGLCLPSGTALTDEDIERIVGIIKRIK